MLQVNIAALTYLTYRILPSMRKSGCGAILNVSSAASLVPIPNFAVYAATKAFSLVLADALWAELRPHGVDVLAVQPGSTRTPGWLSSQPVGQDAMPAMEPADVVREALAALGVESSVVPGELNRQGAEALARMPRRQAIGMMSEITSRLVRNDRNSSNC